ncbi:YSIRK-type signal peptide-containing protein [Aerococcus sp. CDC-944-U94]|uniref:YSIRK-type signal peptide-containing protein n=1 Tax=Aerococcus urinae (strain CCUG 59500 / ACS-120-V-Col10a) TaxID=2976812 RepID=UPI00227B94AD|nr:YSIRK-type signal peptide-containing protein [Aerococcus sp. Group 1]MCY3054126.1 YSIRK-type signal peptide-containing protein [Aerococcus sp. Group 1]MCY3055856.1 YSIRK-type signal peptide-containing protein [Aerococcus sp. Group 1]
MVGKNNFKLLREKNSNRYYRYSIKRLNIGVASVAVAVGLLFMGDASVVRAAVDEIHAEETSRPVDASKLLTTDSVPVPEPVADNDKLDKAQAPEPVHSVNDKIAAETDPVAEVAPQIEEKNYNFF